MTVQAARRTQASEQEHLENERISEVRHGGIACDTCAMVSASDRDGLPLCLANRRTCISKWVRPAGRTKKHRPEPVSMQPQAPSGTVA